nr:zinc finger protein 488 [Anolis sagrei ordinatus]XP_060622848.1 zinc finger protein 488 [Anolis sagrei ordinatus]
MVKSGLLEQATNFQSLARDLELKMATCDSHLEKGMNCEKVETKNDRKTVLLEKTNCLYEELYSENRDKGAVQYTLEGPFWKFSTGKQIVLKKDVLEQKESAFTEVRRMKLIIEKTKRMEQGNGETYFGKEHQVSCSSGSAFSFVWPTRASGETKSAFSKPLKNLMDQRAVAATYHLNDPWKGSEKLSECISAIDFMRYKSFLTSKCFVGDLNSSQLLQTSLVQSNTFPYAAGLWPRQTKEHMQTTSTSNASSSFASLTLLPPTFTSFGVAAQNWCAKCNLSFRMTSDLVFHMRSHHKKESIFPESHGKRRREEKLSCPVCQEYFQERHHLSRHMTSHY